MDKKKILFVEDEPEMRSLLALELETSGYEVFLAEDGKKGFELAKKVKPDLIISDVLMPEMDGSQFFKELKASDFGKDIPFIVLTARKKMEDYFEAVGADGFLEKPFQPEELVKKIELVLQRRASSRESPGSKSAGPSDQPGKESESKKDEIIIIHEMAKERKGQEADLPEGVAAGLAGRKKKDLPRKEYFQRKKILILENNMDAYYELQKIFSEMGNTLQVVLTPQECIEEANRIDPDLIILRDLFNKIDAEELASKLKTIPRFQKTPIIIYTNIGEKAVVVNPAGAKTVTFVLNQEGKELLKKARSILET